MQYKNKDYNEEIHDRKKAITVDNPYAEWIARGKAQIVVRRKNTSYRGELVVCSSSTTPKIKDMRNGCMLALVELYETKKIEDLTLKERKLTCMPEYKLEDMNQRNLLNPYYAWFLRNPRRMIEFPVKGQSGIWNLVVEKMEFVLLHRYSSKMRRENETPGLPLDDTEYNIEVEAMKEYDPEARRDGCLRLIGIFLIGAAAVICLFLLL